jgi:vitamin B12 transporter
MTSFAMIRHRRASALSLAAFVPVALYATGAAAQPAQSAATSFGVMAPIVVTPTLFPTPAAEVGSDVTVITDEEIKRKQAQTLPDALKDVPGLNVVQTGGPGGAASVFIRGANSNHTKVLIDGIDVSDPSTPTGAFDFSQVPTWDIERIEVLRGPQSGLYGSDAIGGVINIITKTGSGPMAAHGMTEGGSFGTFNQAAGVSGSQGRANYDFNVVHLRTADLPVTPTNLLAPGETRNDDFSSNKTYSGKVGVGLTNYLSINAIGRYVNSLTRYTTDDFNNTSFPNGVPEASQAFQQEHAFFGRSEAKLSSFDGAWQNAFGVAYTHYNRSDVDPNPNNTTQTYSGDRTKLNWLSTARLDMDRVVVAGLEAETDRIATKTANASAQDRAGFVEFDTPLAPHWHATASVRVDSYSTFGNAATWRLASAYLVQRTGTELRSSYGTGFKAPTLYQLHGGSSANPALQPETSRGFDLGFEQPLLGKRLSFGATYFHNDIHNLIDSGPSPDYKNLNIDQATTYGVENFLAYQPLKTLRLSLGYTYTMATTSTGVPGDIPAGTLLRRPKHKASVEATWTPTEALSLTTTVLWEGSWLDYTRDSATVSESTPGYVLVNLDASYKLTDHATIYGRIDNLLDRQYQEPVGFMQPGLGVFAGIRVSWGGAPGA